MTESVVLTGEEKQLDDDAFIVSKTDKNGRITYVNRTFLRMSGFTEAELLGSDHNLVRHPAMPHGMFRLLWEALRVGDDYHLYIVSRGKDGSHYWAFTTIIPSMDAQGRVVSYFSVRRKPSAEGLAVIKDLYARMCEAEARNPSDREYRASIDILEQELARKEMTYEQLLMDLQA